GVERRGQGRQRTAEPTEGAENGSASRRARRCLAAARKRPGGASYLRCFPTSLVMSNMLTADLPPKTAFRFASALIIRLFLLSCRPFFLMYAQSFLVTSVRGIALLPTISASAALG